MSAVAGSVSARRQSPLDLVASRLSALARSEKTVSYTVNNVTRARRPRPAHHAAHRTPTATRGILVEVMH